MILQNKSYATMQCTPSNYKNSIAWVKQWNLWSLTELLIVVYFKCCCKMDDSKYRGTDEYLQHSSGITGFIIFDTVVVLI